MSKCRYDLSEDCNSTDCLKCVLDKIENEFIERYPRNYANELELGGRCCVFSLNTVLEIIDKYKAEIERKPCINYEDGCEEWAGCPCVDYKAESEDKE